MATKIQNQKAIGLEKSATSALLALEDELWIKFRTVLVIGALSKAVWCPAAGMGFSVLVAPGAQEAREAMGKLAQVDRLVGLEVASD